VVSRVDTRRWQGACKVGFTYRSTSSQRKYQLGTSSFLNVVIVQRDTVARQLAEVNALNQYIRARTAVQQVTGDILGVYSVDVAEALAGQVKSAPSPMPVIPARP